MKKFSYDDAMRQIEAIVQKLESGSQDMSFDDMMKDVELALNLTKACKKTISDAESRLAELTKKAEADD